MSRIMYKPVHYVSEQVFTMSPVYTPRRGEGIMYSSGVLTHTKAGRAVLFSLGREHDMHPIGAVGAERHGLFDVGGARRTGDKIHRPRQFCVRAAQ